MNIKEYMKLTYLKATKQDFIVVDCKKQQVITFKNGSKIKVEQLEQDNYRGNRARYYEDWDYPMIDKKVLDEVLKEYMNKEKRK